jgi:VIT1/CCC1 family predicted Fe2+/Mn2+ transporter
MSTAISGELKNKILRAQKDEITEYHIYQKLAARVKGEGDRQILFRISEEELAHYNFFKKFSGEDISPARLKIIFYYIISRFLGLNFGVRLMERNEGDAQAAYQELRALDPQIDTIIGEEKHHEEQMLALIDQAELAYTGSVVLGLSDALVEMIGVLAGLTLALQNIKIVAIAGLITGIAATLSMAGSEYLSTKEEGGRSPFKAALYTGLAYTMAVIFLIAPYFIFKNPYICLGVSVFLAMVIVFKFTYYISVAKNLSFRSRFLEMATISLGVGFLNFFIGLLVRELLGINI